MRPRTSTWIAWSLGTLWVVLLAPTLLLFTSNLFNPEVEVYGLWVQGTFVGVIFPAIGLFLVSRRPEHPIGWLFCAAGLVVGLDHFCGEYAIYALLAQPGSLPAGQAAAWVSSWLWVPFTVLMLFFLLLFPDGRLPSGRWRSFAWLVGIAAIVGVAVQALLPVPTCEVCPIENPLGIEGLESVAELVDALVEAFLVGVLGSLALASLFLRFRRASGVEHQQIKWLVFIFSVLFLGATLAYIVYSATEARWAWSVGQSLLAVGSVGVPIAMGVAILRYRLYDIDSLIYRTLVYGSLTLLLAAVYFGGVTLTEAIFRTLTGQEEQPQLAIVVSTLVIAALFIPLRRRIQSFIDRHFYRRKYDAGKTLEAFSAKLREETDLDTLNNELVGVVRETMQPAHVSLWLSPETAPKGEQAE
jgi:hypothetical protein